MLTFAVLDANNIVVNVIVADSLATAEQLTGATCAQYDDNNPAQIGWEFNGKSFVDPTTPANN